MRYLAISLDDKHGHSGNGLLIKWCQTENRGYLFIGEESGVRQDMVLKRARGAIFFSLVKKPFFRLAPLSSESWAPNCEIIPGNACFSSLKKLLRLVTKGLKTLYQM